MPTDIATADENDAPDTAAEIAECFHRLVARGLLPAYLAERCIEDVTIPGAPDRYQSWLITRDGRREFVYASCDEWAAEGYLREAIEAGVGRLGYVTRYGRLLYHIGRSPSLKLLP